MPAKPRYETKPSKGSKTVPGFQVAAQKMGTPLMPWQKKGTRLLAELSDDLCKCHTPPRPLPRYKVVVVSVCRQQGKTVLARVAITHRAESEPDLDLYGTAQSRQYAAKHVVTLGDFLQKTHPTLTVKRGVGNEVVEWENGSTYLPISPVEGGGHGDSIDFMLVDEGWAVTSVTMGGIAPAMMARPHSQMLIISTMGTVESHVWNGIRDQGRELATDPTSDPTARMAYIEYSAPTDEAVFEDTCTTEGQPDCVWGQWMPALGLTVFHADIRSLIRLLEASEGRAEVIRAVGNRTTVALSYVWPTDWITKAMARPVQPPAKYHLAVDVNEEPAGASVSTGHRTSEGTIACRVIEWRAGSPSWVPGFVDAKLSRGEVETVTADLGGPSKIIGHELREVVEDRRVPLVDRKPMDVAGDTGALYDALREGSVALVPNDALSAALVATKRKDLGDLWVPHRRLMSVDASPLMSVILAHGAARTAQTHPTLQDVIHL